jgi:hypothetical protein
MPPAVLPARRAVLFPGLALALLLASAAGHARAQGQNAPQALLIETGSAGARTLTLSGPDAWHQLIVTGRFATGPMRDLTRQVRFEATPADVVRVDATGLVTPLRDGQATVKAIGPAGVSAAVAVRVVDLARPAPISFPDQIIPLFTRLGCNTGGCHGKSGGQNGFALSLFGFEAADDYEYLVKEARGRRLFPAAPQSSLLLRKATGSVAHGGGRRLDIDSGGYRLLHRWIAQGAPYARPNDPAVTRIEVVPAQRVLERGGQQQLGVLAHRADGSVRDVTRLAQFEANDTAMATATPDGLVTAKQRAGSVAVMARYQTHVAVFSALVPLGEKVADLPAPKNFIDEHVFRRWQALGLPPSPLADDATFLRRVTIDIAGRLPTLDETTAFLASKDDDRHAQLVDRLLASEDFAYYAANKWGAVLRNRRKSDKDDPKLTQNFHRWIKDSFHENRPLDQFARDILTASGVQGEKPMIVWYREASQINDRVEDVAQLFLGQRIACARCHHHPFEKWSQQDYYGMTAFFTRVEFKEPPPPKKEKGMKEAPPPPPMTVLHKPGVAEALNPRTGKMVRPTGLGGAELQLDPGQDPRELLVDWMVSRDNPYFARTLANRYWKHFLGRGLVEPEDDLRVTNPPTNPELLDALAKYFADNRYDLKKLIRAICTSHTYRLSAEPNQHNADDRQNYSRFQPRRLIAEVLSDAIDDVTQVPATFKGMPAGTRAVRLPDNQIESYFLDVATRPQASSACECERSSDATLALSLHLVNSKELLGRIAKGRAAKLAKDKRPHEERIRELYLVALSREPSAAEMKALVAYVTRAGANVQTSYEDVVWTVINTKEFMFNH